jgi:type II secretory pathway component PulM
MPTNKSILKLKQTIKNWGQYLERLNPQQRRLTLIGGGALLLVLVYLLVIMPIMDLEDDWTRELAQRHRLLVKYQSLIDSKARIVKGNKEMKAALTQAESQFLSGSNPAVASADLQEILKHLAREHGVQVTSTKALQPREAGPYLEVPLQAQLSCTTGQLLTILYQLEHHKKLLFVPELEVNAPRWVVGAKANNTLQVNLVVSGVIKKGKAKGVSS